MENRLVLDTNVLVSALIGGSYPYKIIFEHILENQFSICISEIVLKEYKDVLNRPKFLKFPDFHKNSLKLIDNLEKIAEFYEPVIHLDIIMDEADNRFLELALIAGANFIITGNTNDFTFSEYEGIKIVSPKYFYQNHCKNR